MVVAFTPGLAISAQPGFAPGSFPGFDGGGFLPNVLPGLQLWLDAADSTTITEVSNLVSQWDDKSGKGNNSIQSTGSKQPTTNVSTQGGKNILDFDGGDELEIAHNTAFDMQTNATMFFVAKTTTVAAGVGRLITKAGVWAAGRNAATSRFTAFTIKDYDTVGNQWVATEAQVATFVFDSSDDVQFRKDGSAFETIDGASDPNTNTVSLFLGSSNGTEHWLGTIGEVIYYNRQLSSAEIASVENYLINKWIGFKVPTDLQGLQLWLDADDSSTITEVAGAVSQWNDKSGQGNNVTQGTGSAQPTTNATTQSEKNVLDFDGGDNFSVPAGVFSIPGGPNTVFIVAKRTTETAAIEGLMALDRSGVATDWSVEFNATSGSVDYKNAGVVTSAGNTNTNFQIIHGFRSGTTVSVDVNNGTPTTDTTGADRAAVDVGFIGTRGANNLTGSIAEIIIYNRSLSSAEITNVETFLANKWGISI